MMCSSMLHGIEIPSQIVHDNTLASLSTVNLYVSPAVFHIYEDAEHPQFESMMPYFLLVEIWYVKYKLYLQKNLDG